MAIKSDYITGTLTITQGSVDFTGTDTGWLSAEFREGDVLIDITGATEYMGVVESITGEGSGTLTKPWEGPTLTNVPYRLRYQPDGARSTAQARNLIEILGNGNITAFAMLNGAANLIPMFTGPGAMSLVTRQALVSGANYDVQVPNLAARAAYDGQDQGYAVLVSDVGDGRAAIYSKNSATSGDWSEPAYITGPVGPVSNVPGVVWRGTYAAGTSYAANDGVLYNGSSWRAKISTVGNSPPVLPAIENDQWLLLARAGLDGTGTGDFVGPNGGVADGQLVAFDGATGKAGKLATMPAATVKGRRSGDGTGAVADVSTLHFGIFTPANFASADLTPAEVNTLLGNTLGFYKLASQTGDNIQMPPGFPQTHGVIEGYLNRNNVYGYTWQEFTGTSGNRKWMRRAVNASTWGPWQEIYHQGSIVGSVSQAGGVPTGAIMSGWISTSSGFYRRSADGTQECLSPILSIPSIAQAVGTGFITVAADRPVWTFPAPFAVAPHVNPAFFGVDGMSINVTNILATSATFYLAGTVSRTGLSNNALAHAIGRWF